MHSSWRENSNRPSQLQSLVSLPPPHPSPLKQTRAAGEHMVEILQRWALGKFVVIFQVSGSADGRGRGSDSVSEATALLILPSLIFSCSNLGQN